MNALQEYFNYRQALIDQYLKGDMTKSEYLAQNFQAVLNLKYKPFKILDSVDKVLFNYQFYNAMAKQAKSESQNYYDREIANSYRDKSNYYYNLKDKSTLKILELSDYKDTEAYFIKVKSKALKNKLFEIILHDKNMILHSTSKVVLNRLKNENVFNDTVKKSLIDEYINHRY